LPLQSEQGGSVEAGSASAERSPPAEVYRVDDLVIDADRRRVTRGDSVLALHGLSFDLLLTLARAAPELLTNDQLMERVWPGLVVSPETVTQRVKLVRDALGDDSQAPRYVLGVRGRGYRLIARVVRIEERQEPAAPTPPPIGHDAAPLARSPPAPRWRQSRWRAIAVAGLVLVAGVVGFVVWQFGGEPRDSQAAGAVLVPGERTIAVLPMLDMSPGGGNEYLGDGLADELSSQLARVPGLRVAARTSAFAFKGRQADVRTIAQSLGVRYVLEGSVRRDADRIRVTAQLVDARSGFNVWTQSYEREWEDLVEINDELAQAIVRKLEIVLSGPAAQRFSRLPATNLAAFDRYLAGLARLRQPTSEEQLEQAEQAFREALAIDGRFARAYAGLCETYAIGYERTRDPSAAVRAEAACGEALALDSSAFEVEEALAKLRLLTGDGDRAASIYRTAIERNPRDADGYIGLARAFEQQNRVDRAAAMYRRAIEVEPDYWAARSAIGKFYVQHGRAAEAVAQLEAATRLVPASALAFNNLGAAMQMSGDLAGAARAFERSLALEPTRSGYSNTGTMYYLLGRFADAAAMFRKAAALAGEDHRVWGNLADALHQAAEGRAETEVNYRRAILLAERDLRVNAQDAVGWAQLGFYYARIGEERQARRAVQRALGLRSDLVFVQYYASLVDLELGDVEGAVAALGRAVERGYSAPLARVTPDFARLRGDARFEEALDRAGRARTD
jgi:TolB-like protein/DNA-binding winged helix-turn-helix (wHTH) protein/Flp pilus assembly protein TadD